jgi:hypothetical protein
MPIISCDPTGGVQHLPEALKRYPDRGIVLYNKVSSYSQAGRGKVLLEEKTQAVAAIVRMLAPGKLKRIVRAIEDGRLRYPRPGLIDAATYAKAHNCILVAGDLSRFIRAQSYSRTKNRNAWPASEEFARLRKLTLGVPLATVESPFLSEDERHSLATKRTGKAGPPHKVDEKMAVEIFSMVEMIFFGDSGRVRWDPSLRELARQFPVSYVTIERLLGRPSPTGEIWLDLFQEEAAEERSRRPRVWPYYEPNGIILEPKRCIKKRF